MKKAIIVLAIAMAIVLCGASALAAGHGRGNGARGGNSAACVRNDCACGNWADANGDGVCDNCTGVCGGACGNWVDADGDGVCDNCTGVCGGACGNWADADGDGVCDNCTSYRVGLSYGNGAVGGHHGQGMRAGCCGGRG